MATNESQSNPHDCPETIPKEPYSSPEISDHGTAETIVQSGSVPWLDVPIDELVEALNDEKKAEEMMRRNGWEPKDLMARAELITKKLAATASAVVVV